MNPRPADYKSAALPTELHRRRNKTQSDSADIVCEPPQRRKLFTAHALGAYIRVLRLDLFPDFGTEQPRSATVHVEPVHVTGTVTLIEFGRVTEPLHLLQAAFGLVFIGKNTERNIILFSDEVVGHAVCIEIGDDAPRLARLHGTGHVLRETLLASELWQQANSALARWTERPTLELDA